MEELLPAVIAGDETAWGRLWLALEPLIRAIARNRHFTSRLSTSEDDRDNIVDAVMARLRADDFRRLRDFVASQEKSPGRSFESWVVSVATRTAIDYMRSHPEYHRPSHAEAGEVRSSGSRWVGFEPVPDSSSAPAAAIRDVTQIATAQRMLEECSRILPEQQREALVLWLVDEDHEEIARKLGLADKPAAEKLVRAAVARLRARYGSGSRGNQ